MPIVRVLDAFNVNVNVNPRFISVFSLWIVSQVYQSINPKLHLLSVVMVKLSSDQMI